MTWLAEIPQISLWGRLSMLKATEEKFRKFRPMYGWCLVLSEEAISMWSEWRRGGSDSFYRNIASEIALKGEEHLLQLLWFTS